MMKIGRLWAGRIYGTNTGNVFAEFTEQGPKIVGQIKIMDPLYGLYIYNCAGSFDGIALKLFGEPVIDQGQDVNLGRVEISASLSEKGSFRGTWNSSIGTAGTFDLFPHDSSELPRKPNITPSAPEQIFSTTVKLGPVTLNLTDLEDLAQIMKHGFHTGRVVVSFDNRGNMISKYFDDFMSSREGLTDLDHIKIAIQERHEDGTSKYTVIDLNSEVDNRITTQGVDEAWVVGRTETLHRRLQQNEHRILKNYRLVGVGINQIIFGAMLVAIPEIGGWKYRSIFVLAILLLIAGNHMINSKLIRGARITTRRTKANTFEKLWPIAVHWLSATSSALVAAYLFYILTKPPA